MLFRLNYYFIPDPFSTITPSHIITLHLSLFCVIFLLLLLSCWILSVDLSSFHIGPVFVQATLGLMLQLCVAGPQVLGSIASPGRRGPETRILVSFCVGVGWWQWYEWSGDYLDLRSQDGPYTLGNSVRKCLAKPRKYSSCGSCFPRFRYSFKRKTHLLKIWKT